MRFDQRNHASQVAGLSAQARRAFGASITSVRPVEKAARSGSQRQVSREAHNNRATSTSSVSTLERRPTQPQPATNFPEADRTVEATLQSKTAEQPESSSRADRQSTAASVFQHFFETEHVRDEELRLFLRRDRAVGVASMVFLSLAAEGIGEVGTKLAFT